MSHKISIITICRNAEEVIEGTILSVLCQNYMNLEYIIVDGASTDNTLNIIKKYTEMIQNAVARFEFISEPDSGISDAFNKGIRMSTGEIIGLINAGDGLLEGALQAVDENFKADVDILYGNTICVDKENGIEYLREKPINVDCSKFASKGMVFTHQSAFVRKKLYDEVGLYDIGFKIIMDTELFVRFYNHGAKFKYIDKNLVSMLAGGISSKPSRRIYEEHIEIGRRYGGVNKYTLALHYIVNMPVVFLKKQIKKNKKLWNLLIGKKRRLE